MPPTRGTPKMRTALDVIHDVLFDASQVVIGFTDRLAQGGERDQLD